MKRPRWLRMSGRILLAVFVVGGIAYAIFGNVHVGPSADAQKPVAIACLKRAGFAVTSDVSAGNLIPAYAHVQWEVHVNDEHGASVAILYLADLPGDLDEYAQHLQDLQKTYGDYKGETIEHRGTTVIRLKNQARSAAINGCVDRAARAKET